MMPDPVEYIGYLAMALLVISFIPKQLKAIRIINFSGCIFFVIYGVLLGWKWPIIISNGLIAVIQLYHLFVKKQAPAEDKRA
ncbi:uroporphyrinogen decarboxylase [Niabella sp. CC-SYL272]|uniref:uroporphyrinogen decarboxylase n=1 Tax=Niabella agricola TaxID=2891571 RepID=UPI001F3D90DA|nr:uroporphyrinogen decarboxylase [Niabella agricola]MCF3107751.1 uroporphyrinogen decarboxylase [Niabella agricola]